MTIEQHDLGDLWDENDILALQEYARRGVTHQQIGELMGRSKSAVNSKLYRLRRAVQPA